MTVTIDFWCLAIPSSLTFLQLWPSTNILWSSQYIMLRKFSWIKNSVSFIFSGRIPIRGQDLIYCNFTPVPLHTHFSPRIPHKFTLWFRWVTETLLVNVNFIYYIALPVVAHYSQFRWPLNKVGVSSTDEPHHHPPTAVQLKTQI